MALDLIQNWREETLHRQSARFVCLFTDVLVKFELLVIIRIAETVEELHSEFARRIQLQSNEESRNETFHAKNLVFTEMKVFKITLITFAELTFLSGKDQLSYSEWS